MFFTICPTVQTAACGDPKLLWVQSHVADMNTDTLVVFWLIWLVCWLMGSVCVSVLGAGVFLDLRKVPGPFCVPSKPLPVKNFKCFLLQVN